MKRRFTFFGGKGGVGKTTCAAAAAVRAAREGGTVLVVSTDPAHSLGDVLAQKLGPEPREVAPRLWAAQLDADRALSRWLKKREDAFRTIAERGTYLDDDDVDRLLSLALPGVDELVGLVELARLAATRAFDTVVVDTAPTGHTVRLLEMPETLGRLAGVFDDMHAKHRFMTSRLGAIRYRPDFADEVIADVEDEAKRLVVLLREAASFTFVTLPEAMSVEETKDGVRAVEAMGVSVATLVVNRVWPAAAGPCAACGPRVAQERAAMDALVEAFPRRNILVVPATDEAPRGIDGLAALASSVGRLAASPLRRGSPSAPPATLRSSQHAARDRSSPLELPTDVRLVLVGGKGGVGKTTIACTTALDLAAQRPRAQVLLLSTDPAHSLGDALAAPVGDAPTTIPGAPRNLRVRELDAKKSFEVERDHYRAAIDELFASIFRGAMDATFDRQVLEDLLDLAPPGIDEIFALLAIVDALAADKATDPPFEPIVVVDTAPTGHTLRLLELPSAVLDWIHAVMAILLKYRHVVHLGALAEDLTKTARRIRALGALLVDRDRTAFVAVTRAAEMPVLETERMLRALAKLGVPVAGIVVNAMTGPVRPNDDAEGALCARCAARRVEETSWTRRLAKGKLPMWGAPASWPVPRGIDGLSAFGARLVKLS